MVSRIFKLLSLNIENAIQVRHRFSRGKAPPIARNLKARLKEIEYADPTIHYKVNIGFSLDNYISKDYKKDFKKILKNNQNNPELERQSLTQTLNVDLNESKQIWLETSAPQHIYEVAKYYGIFDDLYKDGYFYPVVPMTIDYESIEDLVPRVHRGNILSSSQAQQAPSVKYFSKPDSLWTLLLTTPDGNYSDPNMEYCHWFIGNILGNDISKGEQLIDYLRPIPAKGIGFCRYIFVLYKQHKKIDFSEYKKEHSCFNLTDRNWKTYDFIFKHQDYMTPAGLAFFQANYDDTLIDFYHNVLNMESPTFEYDFPKPYLRPPEWFPKRKPFDVYMDKYRDPKQINKEFLLKKLKNEHPFKFPDPPLKYPNAHAFTSYKPSWLKTKLVNERLGLGQIKDFK